jgi:glycosyltransferase involved in cell wall biosynthesis
MPYFSVITPSFNQGPYMETCIRSVLEQGDSDFEHLVFDNCSTDETAAVLAKYPHLKVRIERDRGQSDAVNKGFLAATGEIICWLNSDDAYPPGLFARLREVFENPEVDAILGDATQVAYDGTGSRRYPGQFDNREDLVRWWSGRARIHQPAVFFRRRAREAAGLLREDLHYAMDYEYWWRLSEHCRFHYVPEILAIQHRQPESKTVLDWSKVYTEREKIFAPFYGRIDGGDREALLREKRRAMAERYLGEAFLNARQHPSSALKAWWRSFRERPAYALHPRSLGLLPRLAGLR